MAFFSCSFLLEDLLGNDVWLCGWIEFSRATRRLLVKPEIKKSTISWKQSSLPHMLSGISCGSLSVFWDKNGFRYDHADIFCFLSFQAHPRRLVQRQEYCGSRLRVTKPSLDKFCRPENTGEKRVARRATPSYLRRTLVSDCNSGVRNSSCVGLPD